MVGKVFQISIKRCKNTTESKYAALQRISPSLYCLDFFKYIYF